MQPFFPMPPGYNPYNPFFNTSNLMNLNLYILLTCCFSFTLAAPPYPMAELRSILSKVILIDYLEAEFISICFSRLWC